MIQIDKKIKILMVLCSISVFAFAQVNTGDTAPGFKANDQNGELWKSSDHYGKKYLVIYFYPAAMTFGCTKQACSYRDSEKKLQEMDVEVIGISGDAVKNLKVFEQEHQLNFTLLSDINGIIAQKFGVPVSDGGEISKKTKKGEVKLARALTTKRWTFIIDKNKKIVYIDKGVNPVNDSKNVLKFIQNQAK